MGRIITFFFVFLLVFGVSTAGAQAPAIEAERVAEAADVYVEELTDAVEHYRVAISLLQAETEDDAITSLINEAAEELDGVSEELNKVFQSGTILNTISASEGVDLQIAWQTAADAMSDAITALRAIDSQLHTVHDRLTTN